MSTEAALKKRVLDNILVMDENVFSKQYLLPLFGEMGFFDVDFYGGPGEGGKDIVCWKNDDIGFLELTLVQVKKYKPSAKSADKESFSRLVSQLEEMVDSEVPNKDGKYYPPDRAYFITPYKISTRALEKRFKTYSKELRSKGVRVIDGNLLFKLFIKYYPGALVELAGKDFAIQNITTSVISNKDLLYAIESKTDKNIENFYIDLDFGVGKINTRFFFSQTAQACSKGFRFSDDDWRNIKKINKIAEDSLKTSVILGNIAEIESQYHDEAVEYEKLLKKITIDKNNESQTIAALQKIEAIFIYRSQGRPEKETPARHNLRRIAKDHFDKIPDLVKNYRELLTVLLEIKNEAINKLVDPHVSISIKSKLSTIKLLESSIIQRIDSEHFVAQYFTLLSQLISVKNRIIINENRLIFPEYSALLDGESIGRVFTEKKKWLNSKIDYYNQTESYDDLAGFLKDAHDLFKIFDVILGNKYICHVTGIDINQKYALTSRVKLNIGIDKILNTNSDFLVLGEAGAGKTTTLLMFAKHQLKFHNNNETLYIYIPLSHLYSASKSNDLFLNQVNSKEKLLIAIVNYLGTLNLNVTLAELKYIMNTNKVKLLLDGVDEVVNKFPEIISGLAELKGAYPNCEIITSSRMSGEYISTIPFLEITLLPFTDEQKKLFVKEWFKDGDISKSEEIINHLDLYKELSDVIQNPLLATILCVIASHNLPLPDSEVKLYKQRFDLLLGRYDYFKDVHRIHLDSDELLEICQRIAFELHTREERNAYKNGIINIIHKSLSNKYSYDKLEMAIDDLIDPCNILIPMTEDGRFGFGHLRYQEYMTANELIKNRGITIGDFLYSKWWKDVMVFFSQLTPNISFLIDWLCEWGDFKGAADTFAHMISVRPESEKRELIKKYEERNKFSEDQFAIINK